MDAFLSRQIEDESSPPLWARMWLRLRFGPDSCCDNCGRRTWWNGNVNTGSGIRLVFCDHCDVKFR